MHTKFKSTLFYGANLSTISKSVPPENLDCKMVNDESSRPLMYAKISDSVKIHRFSKKEKSRILHMRQILLGLRNACQIYQYSDINNLHPKQKNTLKLWEHIQDCRDKDCKRKYCRSSCLILEHYFRCKRSNKSTKCKLCAPVERYCRRANQLTNNEKSTRKRKHMDQFSINNQSNNALSIGYKQKQIPEEAEKSQIAGKRHKLNTERRRYVIRWDKSVKGGEEEDSLVPALCCEAQHMNKRISNQEACKTLNINDVTTSKKNSSKSSFEDLMEVFVGSSILEEDRRKIVDASITLTSLKKSVAFVKIEAT